MARPLLTVMRVFIYGKRNAHTINFAIYQPRKKSFKLRICVVVTTTAIGSIKIIIDT